MDLDLRLVRHFIVVADELHFSRAAATLHISQPALSKDIRHLEADLGFRLLSRDSRHVALTPEGTRFLRDARALIAQAVRMTHPEDDGIRMAHIFDLDTSRLVADAFSERFPEIPVMASSMDSRRQFDALLAGLLDVAIIRLTPEMSAAHPTGWRHAPLRLEPFWLVRRSGDVGTGTSTASLFASPLQVFGDPTGTATFNVHGQYLAALEQRLAVPFRWLGNPGTFEHCRARMQRMTDDAVLLEFESYAFRYRQVGMPIHRPAELQPVYPWSLVWRDEPAAARVSDFVEVAQDLAQTLGWLTPESAAPLWQPGVL
ncbi:LysR family transcriptional regulator [Microbacterium mangrovi]|uniref:LysR family transcriptional regulator n=1 Tax=Microbacterium mangrovi TaxID=1348253 RepID=A0A0B2AD76_9MICO|nr:LysR family transcriptional regulator [Microbacterium mangrovi]KHK99596.1 LysR family transcriptional regulator [Microbacterium mangrovi]